MKYCKAWIRGYICVWFASLSSLVIKKDEFDEYTDLQATIIKSYTSYEVILPSLGLGPCAERPHKALRVSILPCGTIK